MHNGYTHSTTGPSSLSKRPESSWKNIPELRTQRSNLNQATIDSANIFIKKEQEQEQGMSGQETGMVNNNFLLTMCHF